MDIGGTTTTVFIPPGGKNSEPSEIKCTLRMTKRPWFTTAVDWYKLEGEVERVEAGKKSEKLWRIEGAWNSIIRMAPYTNGKVDESKWEIIFEKPPYPPGFELQYGMTTFMRSMNYLPRWLEPYLPPTDVRRRPDQAYLEQGELVKAAKEKERLEIKQRKVRKWREENNIKYEPAYFTEQPVPDHDGKMYFLYNGKYWENDRKKQEWDRLFDLYSEALPFEE